MYDYTLAKVFLRKARVSLGYDYLVVFLYTGKSDWIIHLNVESKDNFGMVNCERQFFKSHNVIGKFYHFTNYLSRNYNKITLCKVS